MGMTDSAGDGVVPSAFLGLRTSGPSLPEVLSLFVIATLLTVTVLSSFVPYQKRMRESADKAEYGRISEAIREWSFEPPIAKKYFWGFPLGAATTAGILGLDDAYAMLALSTLAAFLAVVFVFRLWGATVAALFAIVPDWLQQTALGGAETVFAASLFGGFWLARNDRWILSAIVLSYATLVRPVAIFALLGIGIALLAKRRYGTFALVTAISLAIGCAYLGLIRAAYGDPMAHFAGYGPDWRGGRPVGLPFAAMIRAIMSSPPLLNTIKTLFWIVLAASAVGVAVRSKLLQSMWRTAPAEVVFACSYLAFLFSYDSGFAWSEFPRFLLPVVPFVIAAFSPFMPRSRAFFVVVSVAAGLLAGASAVNVREVISRLVP